MNNFVICVDIDGVVNDLMEKTVALYNTRYNASLTLENFKEYDIFKDLPYDEAVHFVELWNEKDLWMSLEPRKDSQWGIKKLVDSGFEVYFATSTYPENFPWKVEWLKCYFSMVPENNIIRINNKGLLNCDIMIDDYAKNLIANKMCHRILFDCNWNQDINDDAYLISRVHNWEEIIEVVNKIYFEE